MRVLLAERKGPLWAGVALALFFVAVSIAVVLFASPDAAGHAFFHLIPGTTFGLGGIAIGWFWRGRLSTLGQLSRVLFIVGLGIISVGLLVESVGAFAWVNDNEEADYEALRTLHNMAWVSWGGLPVLALAALAALLSRIKRRAYRSG